MVRRGALAPVANHEGHDGLTPSRRPGGRRHSRMRGIRTGVVPCAREARTLNSPGGGEEKNNSRIFRVSPRTHPELQIRGCRDFSFNVSFRFFEIEPAIARAGRRRWRSFVSSSSPRNEKDTSTPGGALINWRDSLLPRHRLSGSGHAGCPVQLTRIPDFNESGLSISRKLGRASRNLHSTTIFPGMYRADLPGGP